MNSPAYEVARRWGYLHNPEVDLLLKTISGVPGDAPTIINIGAGTGTSSLAIRSAKPNSHIFTIDKSKGGPLGGLENEVHVFDEFHLKLPTQILSDSGEAGKVWVGGPVDVVLIDGDHSEAGCDRDILNWEKHLKPGGLMIFHDYTAAVWPTVTRSVDKNMIVLGYEKIEIADTLAVFKKPAELVQIVKPAAPKKVSAKKKA